MILTQGCNTSDLLLRMERLISKNADTFINHFIINFQGDQAGSLTAFKLGHFLEYSDQTHCATDDVLIHHDDILWLN